MICREALPAADAQHLMIRSRPSLRQEVCLDRLDHHQRRERATLGTLRQCDNGLIGHPLQPAGMIRGVLSAPHVNMAATVLDVPTAAILRLLSGMRAPMEADPFEARAVIMPTMRQAGGLGVGQPLRLANVVIAQDLLLLDAMAACRMSNDKRDVDKGAAITHRLKSDANAA